MRVGERLTLAQAYQRWKAAQPNPTQKPLPMVLVASEGGASRAGYWTAAVLAAIHERSQGRLASSLFAINSVSGGSVGAVGYAAMLHQNPRVAPLAIRSPLLDFAGRDVLSPVLTGLLFPDLLQRFIPVPLLPDRAEALERGWEVNWSRHCTAEQISCLDLLRQPFLTLGPSATGEWTPLVMVQGAGEETGRRIITSKLAFTQDQLDADDFYKIVNRDVPISTAIHNGARFPWISPAGTLASRSGTYGHIVDGGYFEVAGVETIRELARAIQEGPGKSDNLRFVFVFIGYNAATEEASPPSSLAPPQLLNELRAPVVGLFRSRSGHGEHMMRELKLRGAASPEDVDPFKPSANAAVEYVPIILCNQYKGEKETFEPPMDWALSEKAKTYMLDATGFGSTPECLCHGGVPPVSPDTLAIEPVLG